MIRSCLLILIFALAGCDGSKHAQAQPEEITYCRNGGEEQKLDIYTPLKSGPGRGTIIHIHGGGYVQGDKRGWFEFRRAQLLTSFGFTLVSISYRFAPKHIYPAQLEDAKCALNWLNANGPARGIDTRFIGLMGDSAGGHLAALIGVLGDTGQAPIVGAVAAFYAPFDLVDMEPESKLEQAITPSMPTTELRALYSPIRHISANDPPFLLIHGKNDLIVSVAQSVKFAVGLDAAGHTPLMIAVENARHGLFPLPKDSVPKPSQDEIDKILIRFFVAASNK